MSSSNEKVRGYTFRVILNVILIVLYAVLLYAIAMMLFGETENYILIYIALWIPVSVLSVLIVILNVLTRHIYRARLIMICFNAVFIPLIFLVGYTDLVWLNGVLGALFAISALLYVISFILGIKNKNL